MVGIYRIKNQINGKCYIGQSVNIERRWREHRNYSSQNSHYPLYKDFRKFGLENFCFEVVEECSVSELNAKEEEWIQKENSFYCGYNQTLGSSYPHFQKLSKENLEEISNLLKNTIKTNEEIAIIFNISDEIVSGINTGRYHRRDIDYPIRNQKTKFSTCLDCGKAISLGASRCVECSLKERRTVERPSKEELFMLLRQDPNFSKLGRKYGVTDNAVRKWCKFYNIPTKTSEYKAMNSR